MCSTKDTWGLTYAAWSSPKKCPRASRQVHWSSCRVGISALLLLRKSAKVLDLPSGAPPCSCLGAISAVDDPFRRVSDCGCSCLLGCQGPVQVQGDQGLMDWLVIQEAHDHEQGRGHAIGSGRCHPGVAFSLVPSAARLWWRSRLGFRRESFGVHPSQLVSGVPAFLQI